jgi:hypothetical protein
LEVHAISKKIRTDFSAFHIKQSYRNTFAFESASQKTFNLYFNNFDVVYGSAISFLPRVNPPNPNNSLNFNSAYLFAELGCLDFDEGSSDRLHVRPWIVKRDPAGSDRILVLVRVYPRVDHPVEQIVHYLGQTLGVEHPVEGPHEHRLARVQLLRGGLGAVRVVQDPRYHLDL